MAGVHRKEGRPRRIRKDIRRSPGRKDSFYESLNSTMAGRRFTNKEIEERRSRVSELYLQGFTMRDIGLEVGVHFTQVFSDIKVIRSDWRSNQIKNFEMLKNQELAKCDIVEIEAWKGWARTVGLHKVKRQELGVAGDGSPNKRLVTTEEKFAGDPRFLAIVMTCVKQRCDILGINSPIETRLTGRLSIQDLRDILDTPDEEEKHDGEGTGIVQ